jgi:hypothetical protein
MWPDDSEDNLILLPVFEREPVTVIHARFKNGFRPLDLFHAQRGMPRVRDQDLELLAQLFFGLLV